MKKINFECHYWQNKEIVDFFIKMNCSSTSLYTFRNSSCAYLTCALLIHTNYYRQKGIFKAICSEAITSAIWSSLGTLKKGNDIQIFIFRNILLNKSRRDVYWSIRMHAMPSCICPAVWMAIFLSVWSNLTIRPTTCSCNECSLGYWWYLRERASSKFLILNRKDLATFKKLPSLLLEASAMSKECHFISTVILDGILMPFINRK